MKMFILAIVLILGGIPNISSPENSGIGIAATLAGVCIIIYKIIAMRNDRIKRQEAEEYVRQVEAEERELVRRAEIAQAEFERSERERLEKSQAWRTVQTKWQVIIEEHARLQSEIGVAYTIANNLNLPDSPQMQHVIDLCNQDIALAEMFAKSQIEIQGVRISNGWTDKTDPYAISISFPTFKRLAIIYEKQKKYDDAIAVCQKAIELGFPDDGTDGQMPGRIARLMRKKGQGAKKIKASDEIVINDSTGEVIDVE